MKSVSLAIIATVAGFAAASVRAEQAPALETSIAAARKAEQSFNTGDAEAFSLLYTKEAIFVFDGNTVFEGRDAARDAFARYFADHPGASLEIAVADARWLTPGVLADSGFATVTKADGSTETTRFSSVAVQENGALRIARLEETPISPDEGVARIAELEWLVGSWQDAEHPETTSSVTLTHNRRFLVRSFTVQRGEEDPLLATEIVGFDAAKGQLRSWVFDSDGGIAEGSWRRDDQKWLVTLNATLPDGSRSAAQHVISKSSDDAFTWHSINRSLNGEILPNLDPIHVIRSKD
jgi:uncharacterized protein (TIGR02246 family)